MDDSVRCFKMNHCKESPTKTNEPEKNIPNDMASDSQIQSFDSRFGCCIQWKKAIKNIK